MSHQIRINRITILLSNRNFLKMNDKNFKIIIVTYLLLTALSSTLGRFGIVIGLPVATTEEAIAGYKKTK